MNWYISINFFCLLYLLYKIVKYKENKKIIKNSRISGYKFYDGIQIHKIKFYRTEKEKQKIDKLKNNMKHEITSIKIFIICWLIIAIITYSYFFG